MLVIKNGSTCKLLSSVPHQLLFLGIHLAMVFVFPKSSMEGRKKPDLKLLWYKLL